VAGDRKGGLMSGGPWEILESILSSFTKAIIPRGREEFSGRLSTLSIVRLNEFLERFSGEQEDEDFKEEDNSSNLNEREEAKE